MKDPEGVDIPLGPFSFTFQRFRFFTKSKYIFKKEVSMKTKIAVLVWAILVFFSAHVVNAQQPGEVPILGMMKLKPQPSWLRM